MKNIPRKYQYPLMVSMVLPSMLLGMSGIMAYRNLPAGANFITSWGEAIVQVVPSALLLLVVIAPMVRLFVTKVLLQPEEV
jgi:hypothetical protein